MLRIWMLWIAVSMFLLILHFLKLSRLCKSYPPGPLRLPVIGSIWKLGFTLSQDTLSKLSRQYGNIFSVWYGPLHLVILCGFEGVKEVLVKHAEDFAERPVSPFLKLLVEDKGISQPRANNPTDTKGSNGNF